MSIRRLAAGAFAVALAGCASSAGAPAGSPTTAGALAAVGSPSGPPPSGPPSTAATAATAVPAATAAETSTSAAPTTTAAAASGPITIAFAGDVHGEPPIAGSLRKGVNPLAKVSGLLSGADVAVVNLETTIAGAAPAGTAQDKTYVFRSTPALLGAVRSAGVDVVSVANNHSYDYGRAGFLATLDQIGASGLQVAGGGHDDAEAYRPAIVDVRGTKVAIVGIARIGPDDVGRATATTPGTTDGRNVRASAAAIAAAKAQAPIVIAFLHWGTELADCATANDRALATALLKAGASAVVGAHPHVLQGISEANGKLVAWSLGNFVFYATKPIARQTGVLTVTFDPTGAVTASRFDPARIDGSGSPVPQPGKAGADIRARLDRVTPGHGTCPAYAMP